MKRLPYGALSHCSSAVIHVYYKNLHDEDLAPMPEVPRDMIPPETPDEICSIKEIARDIQVVLDTLTPTQIKVIQLRYGINCERAHTIYEVANALDVCAQRVSQIEAKALRRLRHKYRIDILKHHID